MLHRLARQTLRTVLMFDDALRDFSVMISIPFLVLAHTVA